MIGDRGPKEKNYIKIYKQEQLIGCVITGESETWCANCLFEKICHEGAILEMGMEVINLDETD